VNDLVEAIKWPTYDPRWVSKIVVMSLITIIPIVGAIAIMGWLLAALDNARAGRNELPPAGFAYLGRGVSLFVASVVYGLVVAGGYAVLLVVGAVLASAGQNSAAMGGLGAFFAFLGIAWLILGLIALAFATPAIILAADRGGIGAALNVPALIDTVRTNPMAALMAAIGLVIAYFLGSLGSFVCFIGVYLTIAYAYAMAARVVRGYEVQLMAPAAPPAPAV
jgi:hypothetical protein